MKKGFKKYQPGQIDKDIQSKQKISELENLILKPHRDGIINLTIDELQMYINLDIDELRAANLSEKMVVIAEETKKYLLEHKQEIEEKIKQEEEYER